MRPSVTTILWCLFVISRVAVFALMVGQGSDIDEHDGYAHRMRNGELPFRDFNPEYPPLALLFDVLPTGFSNSAKGYERGFESLCCIADLVAWTTVSIINKSRPLTSLLYILCTAANGCVLYDRLDIVLGVILLFSLLSVVRGAVRRASLLAGIGIALKLIPIVWFMPLMAMAALQGTRTAIISLLFLVLPLILTVAPLYALGARQFDSLIKYHAERSIQIESLPASIEMCQMLTGKYGTISIDHGSVNLETQSSAFIASVANGALLDVILAVSGFVLIYRPSTEQFCGLLAGVLSISVCLSKVFSPQYVCFLIPVIACLPVKCISHSAGMGYRLFLFLVFIVALATGVVFPWNYDHLVRLEPLWECIIIIRNVGLASVALWLLVAAVRSPDSGQKAV